MARSVTPSRGQLVERLVQRDRVGRGQRAVGGAVGRDDAERAEARRVATAGARRSGARSRRPSSCRWCRSPRRSSRAGAGRSARPRARDARRSIRRRRDRRHASGRSAGRVALADDRRRAATRRACGDERHAVGLGARHGDEERSPVATLRLSAVEPGDAQIARRRARAPPGTRSLTSTADSGHQRDAPGVRCVRHQRERLCRRLEARRQAEDRRDALDDLAGRRRPAFQAGRREAVGLGQRPAARP